MILFIGGIECGLDRLHHLRTTAAPLLVHELMSFLDVHRAGIHRLREQHCGVAGERHAFSTLPINSASNYTERFHNLIYMPSPRSSRINLEQWRQRAGLRTANESLAIKRCIWQWGLLSAEHRKPATQGELARALGVRRSYVWRVLKRLPFDAPIEMLAASPITPGHVIAMRQVQQQCRQQQDEQARREAEDWIEAWREEDVPAQQQGYQFEQQSGDSDAYPNGSGAKSGAEELRRIVHGSDDPEDRELAKAMFPWLKL